MNEQNDETRDDSNDEGLDIEVEVADDDDSDAEMREGHDPAEVEAPEHDESVESDEPRDAHDAEAEVVDEDEDLFVSADDSDVEVIDEETDLEETSDGDEPDREALLERIDTLESTVDRLEDERDDFKERMLRAAADLENYRKRAEKEKEELKKYGAKHLVKDLLSTIDNLERALEHAQSGDEANIIDGVDMVLNQIHDTFEKHGIEVFDAEGNEFDPELHEAIQQVETTEHTSGTVVEQFQRGYQIHDRLLRPAMVSVAENIADDEDDEASSSGPDENPSQDESNDGDESPDSSSETTHSEEADPEDA